jgi:subtilisin family serine protease
MRILAIALLAIPSNCLAIINGVPPAPESAVRLSVVSLIANNNTYCSAVLVGPNAVITASHCIRYVGTDSTFKVDGAVTGILRNCESAPSDPTAAFDASIAACILEQHALKGKPATVLEALVTLGETLIVSGVGCNSAGGVDRSFGKIRSADARVISVPGSTAGSMSGLFSVSGGEACPGDSGGGVFDSESNLIGLIAGGDSLHHTYISGIGQYKSWLVTWATRNRATICGGIYDPQQQCAQAQAQVTIVPSNPHNDLTHRAGITVMGTGKETLRQLYERVCGVSLGEDENLFGAISSAAGIAVSTVIGQGQAVNLPSCPISDPGSNQLASGPGRTVPIPVSTILKSLADPIFSLSETDANSQCDSPLNPDRYPYDAAQLLDVLRSNHEKSGVAATAEIIVADNGLTVGGHGIFPPGLFSEFRGEWRQLGEAMRPVADDKRSIGHGTEVASVVLGGPTFAFAQAYANEPRFRLIVLPIYQSYGGQVAFDPNTFSHILDNTARHPGSIVNLSFKASSEISEITREINRDNSSVLFVVAAGNDGKRLDFAGGGNYLAAYPALYGGDQRARLITVAALDGKGHLAKFSNWSQTYVDIAAPGCEVPVITVSPSGSQLQSATKSGTSLAAPLVTFAAALIRSETDMAAEVIKRRLLITSDLSNSGDLAQKVVDGRKLNIIKAASTASDIAQLDDGIHIGTAIFMQDGKVLQKNDRVHIACDSLGQYDIVISNILKLARFGGPPSDPKFRLYYFDAGERNANLLFHSDLCSSPKGWLMKFRDNDTRGEHDVNFNQLLDFVRHEA